VLHPIGSTVGLTWTLINIDVDVNILRVTPARRHFVLVYCTHPPCLTRAVRYPFAEGILWFQGNWIGLWKVKSDLKCLFFERSLTKERIESWGYAIHVKSRLYFPQVASRMFLTQKILLDEIRHSLERIGMKTGIDMERNF
jgi:hypothetical protein